jgi:hypothetical protein
MSCLHVSARLWVGPILVKKPDGDGASFLGRDADWRSDFRGVSPTMLLAQVLDGLAPFARSSLRHDGGVRQMNRPLRLSRIPPMWTAPSSQGVLQCFDQIACAHMSGLFARSHMNAGQDGFRDESSKQMSDLIEGHGGMRNFSHRGSIDRTICSSCKFWHRLSTVAVELLPVSG